MAVAMPIELLPDIVTVEPQPFVQPDRRPFVLEARRQMLREPLIDACARAGSSITTRSLLRTSFIMIMPLTW
jgi:hypothetical protein